MLPPFGVRTSGEGEFDVYLDKDRQQGFTLIEVIVVVAIMTVLMALAALAWQETRERNRVENAAQEIQSLLSMSRMRALTTGRDQVVTFDLAKNTVSGPVWSDARDYGSQKIDLVAFACSTCAESSSVASKTVTFTSRGTAVASTVKVKSARTSSVRYLTVNGVTGRVMMTTRCTSSGCVP